jgi:Rad3-related DNA helicase
VTLLIDTRFAEGRYRRLFPPWWRPVRVTSAEEVGRGAAAFWKPGRGAA